MGIIIANVPLELPLEKAIRQAVINTKARHDLIRQVKTDVRLET
jgi:hypothetical protein